MSPSQAIALDQPKRSSVRANLDLEANDVCFVSSELLVKVDTYWRTENHLLLNQYLPHLKVRVTTSRISYRAEDS